MNGGRENQIQDNVFLNVDYPLNIRNLLKATFLTQPYYQSNLAPIHSDLWKNTFEGIDEFVTVNKGYPNNSKVIDNVIANPQKVHIADEAYMTVTDCKIIDDRYVSEDGRIKDWKLYQQLVKPIENALIIDGITVAGYSPLCETIYLKKGERQEVFIKQDRTEFIPDQVLSSNNTIVSVQGNNIYALGEGSAVLTVIKDDYEETVKIVTTDTRTR